MTVDSGSVGPIFAPATKPSGVHVETHASVPGDVADTIRPTAAKFAETRLTHRVVVFTSNPSWSVCAGIAAIAQAIPDAEFLLLVHKPPRDVLPLLRSQLRNFRRNGWRWVPYQAHDLFRRLLRRSQAPIAKGAPGYTRTLESLGNRVRVIECTDIHAATTLDIVRAFEPKLGLSLAAPILRRPLFSIPKLGTLNLHKGRLPDYRGMPPAFWELWNGETSVGCTIHWIDDRLDTGDIVAKSALRRERFSTVRGLQLGLDEIGITLMRQAVADVLSGRARPEAQGAGGRTYRRPTLKQAAEIERRLALPAKQEGPWIRRAAKETFFLGSMVLNYSPMRALISPRVTVLLYHSVNDAIRDNLTVGVEQFEWQMKTLRERCVVRSIEDVLSMRSVPASSKPQVCITFDDGYLDNYVNAVPILERYGLPAAFFVSTGMIGTDRLFPHDVHRRRTLPTMSWDQLRDMRSRGFTIGSHSVNHIDCAREPVDVVRSELCQSFADLQRELDLERIIFAYPYGGREHMTPQRLELVKSLGFVGCLSAYGGSNIGSVDPFDVRRRNIQWQLSRRAFLVQCLGLA